MLKLLLTIAILLTASFSWSQEDDFPIKGQVRQRVDFWIKVYTDITTQQAFLHDPEDLTLIYKKVDNLPRKRRSRIRFIRQEKRKLRSLFYSIIKKQRQNLTSEEQSLYNVVGDRSDRELRQLAKRVRMQYGLRDRYYKGLQRSHRYLDHIEKIIEEYGLPQDIKYLPHVESSFNYKAYSKVGAAGIWQFMRSTARLYGLKVNYVIDERRDPIKAAKAAARLIRDNYRLLGTYPLALTAYNHGARSLKRAIKKLGTTDIDQIIERYDGRRFGFASKNFYATFLATVHISKNYQRYFPEFTPQPAITFSAIKLPKRLTIAQISKHLKISKKDLESYNYAIRKSVFRSPFELPAGFQLKLPYQNSKSLVALSNQLKAIKIPKKDLTSSKTHIVYRGQTLYSIARLYGVKFQDILYLNRNINPSRIYPGMKITIPGKNLVKNKKQPIIKAAEVKKPPKVYDEVPVVDDFIIWGGEEIFDSILTVLPYTGEEIVRAEKIYTYQMPKEHIDNKESLESYKLELEPIKGSLYYLVVEPDETLGHYAEWAGVRTQQIRNLNALRRGRSIHLGQKIKISVSDRMLDRFNEERARFHLSAQEDFYENYKVVGVFEYKVRRGDSLGQILRDQSIPLWLARKLQPSLNSKISVGERLSLPKIKTLKDDSDEAM